MNTSVFGREPAAWIGIIVSVILAVVQTLAGQGVISDVLAGKVTDGVTVGAQLALVLAPVLAGLLIRQKVTPTAVPKLEVGTPVLVDTPPGTPKDTPPPDAVVALKSDLKPI